MKNFLIAVCILLVIATAKMPYGYYVFIRVAVCAYCVFAFIDTVKRGNAASISALVLAGGAILYNPLFRIYATKDFWIVANIVTIVILLAVYFMRGKI